MTVAVGLRDDVRRAVHAGPRRRRLVRLCLLAGLAGWIGGCGGGAIAPVDSPSEAPIPGRALEYVVGRGDTVYSIAWRFGIDYRAIAEANSLDASFRIHQGQRLLVPEPEAGVSPSPEPEDGASPSPEPAMAAAGPATSGDAPGDVSTHGLGPQAAPELRPLPPSEKQPEPSEQPALSGDGTSVGEESAPEAPEVPIPVPKASPPAPPLPEAPLAASGQAGQPVESKPAPRRPAKPTATRTVAGLTWSRPATGKTIGTFGRGGNKGLDIAGEFEQPIHAAAPGRVVYAGSGLVGYGKLVIVKHTDRLLSAYAHNERLHVKEGDAVERGQYIADMGRSGAGRVMLHFEVRRDGKPVDPLRYLP